MEGAPTDAKIQLMNQCLIPFFKNKKLTEPAKSAVLVNPNDTVAALECQPSYHSTRMKTLLASFSKKGINMSLRDHFTFDGGIASIMTEHFRDIATRREDYGTRPNRMKTDPNYASKIRETEFDLDNVKDVQSLAAQGLGEQVLLRGGEEIANLMIDKHLRWSRYEEGPLARLRYVQVVGMFDKTHLLSAFNAYARDDEVRMVLVENPNDPYCPFRLLHK
jgi:hypothetical protein